ncbi:hypothetical protein GGI23_001630, partial [Coemansia sp. RSA 2559]
QPPPSQTTPSKRSRDDDVPPSTTENPISGRPVGGELHNPDEGKRPRLVDYGESDDSDEGSIDTPSELPAGFFDTSVPISMDDSSDDDESGKNKRDMTTSVQSKSVKNERLLKDLDSFESEIAGLEMNVSDVRPADPPQPETDSTSGIDAQGEQWKTRTSRLLHLISIIQEGLQEMDENEVQEDKNLASRMDIGGSASESDDSDSSDYASLTDWRMPEINQLSTKRK